MKRQRAKQRPLYRYDVYRGRRRGQARLIGAAGCAVFGLLLVLIRSLGIRFSGFLLLGLAGLGERVPASVEGCDYSAVLRQDAVQPERPRAALYMRNLDGGRDADGLVRGFFAQARGVKTATHTMELRIGRDGTLERVLMFDDAADPYQLHNLAPEEHPALFAALCRELAVLLRDNDDVWFREGVLSDVVPYDTNN